MIREILKMGDPRLLLIADPVDHFDTPELHELVKDMFDVHDDREYCNWPNSARCIGGQSWGASEESSFRKTKEPRATFSVVKRPSSKIYSGQFEGG